MAHQNIVQIPADKVCECLDVKALFTVLERALGNFSKGAVGGVVQPVRTILSIEKPEGNPEHPGFFGVMPVYSAADGVLSCKIVTFYPGNASSNRTTHNATIMLYNSAFGDLLAIMDGDVITATRTAVASVIASKHLAQFDSEKGIKLAILGAGVQARSHARALKAFFNISCITVWSRTMESAFKCAEEIGGEACLTAQEAVDGADIIVTATFSKTPILKKEWIKPGAHINAVGACRPDWQELDSDLVRNAAVYVDSKESALKESGDIVLPNAEIYAEIGEIINGTKPAKKEPYTVFKSLGMGLEDAVSAKLVYEVFCKEQTTPLIEF